MKRVNNVRFIDQKLKKIDQRGAFKSDDEIGWFFNEVKIIQNDLSQFKKENT